MAGARQTIAVTIIFTNYNKHSLELQAVAYRSRGGGDLCELCVCLSETRKLPYFEDYKRNI